MKEITIDYALRATWQAVTKIYNEDMTILTVTEKGYGRRTPLFRIDENGNRKKKENGEYEYNYPVKNRGGLGIKNYDLAKGRIIWRAK